MVRPDGSEIIPPDQIETIVRAVRELDSVQASTFLAVCASHEVLRAERDAIDQALRGYCEGDSAARSGCASVDVEVPPDPPCLAVAERPSLSPPSPRS